MNRSCGKRHVWGIRHSSPQITYKWGSLEKPKTPKERKRLKTGPSHLTLDSCAPTPSTMTSMDQQHLQCNQNQRLNEIEESISPPKRRTTSSIQWYGMILGLGVAVLVVLLGMNHHIHGSHPTSSHSARLKFVTHTSSKSPLSNRLRRRQLLGDEYYQEDDYYEEDDEAPSEDLTEGSIQQEEISNDEKVTLSMTLMVENEEEGGKESREPEVDIEQSLDEDTALTQNFFADGDVKEESEITGEKVPFKDEEKNKNKNKKHDKSQKEKEISESKDDPTEVSKDSPLGVEEELEDLGEENNVLPEGQEGEHFIDEMEEALLDEFGEGDTITYDYEANGDDPETMVLQEEEHNIVVVKEALLSGFEEGTEATNEDELFEVQEEEGEGEEDNSTVHDSYEDTTVDEVAIQEGDVGDDQEGIFGNETGTVDDPLDVIETEEELVSQETSIPEEVEDVSEEISDQDNVILPQEKNVQDIDMNGQDYIIDVEIEEKEEGHADDGAELLIEPEPEGSTFAPTSSPATSSPTLKVEDEDVNPITSDPTLAPTSSPTHSATHGNSTPTPTVISVPVPIRTITTPLPTQKPSPVYTSLMDDLSEDDTIKLEAETKFITEKKAAKIGGWMIALTLALMVMTAYQMSENPDGVFANVCRLVITVCGCVLKIVLFPCKKFFPNRYGGYSNHLVTTSDSFPHDTRGFL